MRSLLRRGAKGVVTAFAVLLVLLLVEKITLFDDLERLTYDFTVDHVGLSKPSPQIILIDFDEETYGHIHQYPVPRTYFADAINRVSAGKPKVIGLDLYLDLPHSPDEDKKLQDALTASGVVVLASQGETATLPAVDPMEQFCKPETPGTSSGFCVEGAPGAMAYGFADMPIDSDGFIRAGNLFTAGNPPSQSYPLVLAEQFTGGEIKPGSPGHAVFNGHQVHYFDPELKTFLIGCWGHEPATRISAWRVLAGQVPASTFTNKLVMIGQTSSAARDTHYTPLFRLEGKDGVRLMMGGTAIQAAAVRTLVEGHAVELAPLWLQLCWIVLIASAAACFLLMCDLTFGLASLMILMGLILGLSLFLYARLRFWLPFLPMETALAITLPFTLGVRFIEERLLSREADAQRRQLMGLFSSYVDPAVAETIWERRSELSLGGEEHIATVMFTDIRGFTALSNGQPPAVVLGWLNRYVIAMDEVIRAHGGFLNKFIGDGLMIIFGLPLGHGPREDARRALDASLAMLARVQSLNDERTDNPEFPHLRIGIGIHTGSLVAGSIGSSSRQEYSVIGETVNLASRLESLNKRFKTEILMSAATAELVADLFPNIEPLGETEVAGLRNPVPVYTLQVAVERHAELTESGAVR